MDRKELRRELDQIFRDCEPTMNLSLIEDGDDILLRCQNSSCKDGNIPLIRISLIDEESPSGRKFEVKYYPPVRLAMRREDLLLIVRGDHAPAVMTGNEMFFSELVSFLDEQIGQGSFILSQG